MNVLLNLDDDVLCRIDDLVRELRRVEGVGSTKFKYQPLTKEEAEKVAAVARQSGTSAANKLTKDIYAKQKEAHRKLVGKSKYGLSRTDFLNRLLARQLAGLSDAQLKALIKELYLYAAPSPIEPKKSRPKATF